jgi:energy-coupling factor transport system ATP-binding protein
LTAGLPFIRAENLSYAYPAAGGRPVLERIDLDLGAEPYLLVGGASGCGKSTLCRTFNGLIPHFYGGRLSGSVSVGGRGTRDTPVARLIDRVGLVFQNPEAQLFNRTVAREIAFGLESLGLDRREIGRRIVDAAAAVGIETLLERHPHHLSGGEQHLAALAAILALRPRVLVLDEPFANLDPATVLGLRRVLAGIGEHGRSLVVCEHRLNLTAPDAGRMVVMVGGRIVADGPPDRVLENLPSPWGLEAPLAAAVSRRLGLAPLHLDLDQIPLGPGAREVLADLTVPPRKSAACGEMVLEVEGLAGRAGDHQVLRDVSFNLHRGEVTALVGANGAGKTTLVRHLNGLARPLRGRVAVAGKETRRWRASALARHVGVAFQNPNSQFFKLTVAEEIRVGPLALGCLDENWLARLAAWLHLTDLMDRAPFRLSGGEKKRVAFAAALAHHPGILVLDEPTAGQDAFFRRALADLLVRLAAEGGAVLMVTHDLAFAERCAGRWLVLCDGVIAADGPPETVMADPALMRRSHLVPTERFRLAARLEEIGAAGSGGMPCGRRGRV